MKISSVSAALILSALTFTCASPRSVYAENTNDKTASSSKTASTGKTSSTSKKSADFEPDRLAHLNNEGILAFKAKKFELAESSFEKVIAGLKEEKLSELSLAEVLANLSLVQKQAGKTTQAEETLKEAKTIRARYHMPALDPNFVDILPSAALRKQGSEMVKETVDILEGKDKLFPPGTIKDLSEKAWSETMQEALVHKKAGDLKAEFLSLRRALTIANTFPKPNDKVVSSMNLLADLYRHMGRPYSARMLFLQCVKEHDKMGKSESADYATLLDHAAQTMLVLHENKEAEKLLEQAITIYKEKLGPESPDLAMAMSTLGELYIQEKNHENGEQMLQQALAIMKKTLKADDPRIVVSEDYLGTYYSKHGKLKEAEELQKDVLSKIEKHTGNKTTADLILAVNNLAQTMNRQKKYEEAAPLYKRCVEMNKELYGNKHSRTMHSIGTYASFLEKSGHKEEADRLLKEITKPN